MFDAAMAASKKSTYMSDKWPAKIKGDIDWCKVNGIDYVLLFIPDFCAETSKELMMVRFVQEIRKLFISFKLKRN
jgi:hypothetical protein